MRRWMGLLLLAAAIPAAASLVPGLRADGASCAMACHAGKTGAEATCCLLGATSDRPVLQSCSGSQDGVPPAPGCSLFAPMTGAVLAAPVPAGASEPRIAGSLISMAPEPADPIPLRLS